MTEEKQFASDCEILSIPIWKVGEDNGKPHANLMGIAASFRYYEDVLWPSYGGSIVVMDTGMNLISTMPHNFLEIFLLLTKTICQLFQPQLLQDFLTIPKLWKFVQNPPG